jgi:hypothetical protein
MDSIWQKTKAAFKTAYTWLLRYPVALIISIGVVLVAVLMLMFGVGDRFNVGGVLGKLFGTDGPEDDSEIKVANKVPKGRVDKDGKPIKKGEADETGWVQQEVELLDRSSNPFRDKKKIRVKTSTGEKSIKLPTGVEDTDVEQVIEITPKNFEVVVKEGPKKVDQDTIDYLRS